MKKYLRPALALIIGALMVISGCNLPAGIQEPVVEAAAPVVVETATVQSVQACEATVTANVVANVRSGPDTIYNIVGSIPQGGSAKVVGHNDLSTWWYIVFPGGPGGYAWIAGSVSAPNCIPPLLQIVAAPPPPVAQEQPQQQPQQEEPQPEDDGGDSGDPGPVGPVYEINPDLFFPFFIWTPTPTPISFDLPDFDFDFGWP